MSGNGPPPPVAPDPPTTLITPRARSPHTLSYAHNIVHIEETKHVDKKKKKMLVC